MKKITILMASIISSGAIASGNEYIVRATVAVPTSESESIISQSKWHNVGVKNSCKDWVNSGSANDQDAFFTEIGSCQQMQERSVVTATCDDFSGICSESSSIEHQMINVEGTRSVARNNASCKTLIEQDLSLSNGTYSLSDGSYYCDMSTNGGGWTRMSASNMVALSPSFTVYNGEYSVGSKIKVGHDATSVYHDIVVKFTLPVSYTQFRMSSYSAKDVSVASNHECDIGNDFSDLSWNTVKDYSTINHYGDISFGSPDDSKPVVSYGSANSSYRNNTHHANHTFPGNGKTYSIGSESNRFAIRSTEYGGEEERLHLHNEGYIYFR